MNSKCVHLSIDAKLDDQNHMHYDESAYLQAVTKSLNEKEIQYIIDKNFTGKCHSIYMYDLHKYIKANIADIYLLGGIDEQ